MTSAERNPARPHLVMVSGSHAQFDARVRKSASTAAAAGYRVTVVAPSPDGLRADLADLDGEGWLLANVPVGSRAREATTRPRTLGRLGYRDPAQARQAQERLAAAELASGNRTTPELRLRRWLVGKRTVVMRYRQTRRIWSEPWARPVVRLALRVPALSTWQRLAPESLDLDEAFAPVVDALQPDLLQSHDVQTINVVAGASARAGARGRRLPWIYDAHEHIAGLTAYAPDRLAGLVALEAAFIREADGVLTVCDPIADDLRQRFGLAERPTVVLNAPPLLARPPGAANGRSLRADTGLGPGTPIVVYSGKVDAARGIDDLAGALTHLSPAVHVVLITNRPPGDAYLARVRLRLQQQGCADRLHTVPYVASDELVGYLSGADVGFAGFSHIGNHEVSMPNKFFDYLHAGVPMVVSDLRLLGPLVRSLGVGLVYPFGEVRALAAAITRILQDRDPFLAAATDEGLRRTYSWQAQEPALLSLYGRLVPVPGPAAAR
jgi:glycosyltransferase involved in cell wall biosynthesis